MSSIEHIKIDFNKLQEDLRCSVNTLSADMVRQAPLYCHYGTLLAQASRNVDVARTRLELIESQTYKALRESWQSTKPLTEEAAKRAIARQTTVIDAKEVLIEARFIEKTLTTIVESFRHRKDMLIQMGLLTREEMKGELSIRAKQTREELISSNADILSACGL